MIIYIHGFASSGFGAKATQFKNHFKQDIIMPSLSHIPSLAIHTLEQLIEVFQKQGQKVHLVGSSLGGFYALYLANKYNLKAVLINPAIYPYKTLDKIGIMKNYFDGSTFEVTQEHLHILKGFETKEIYKEENFMVLLQKGDEVLDYNQAVQKLPKSTLCIQEGGNHTFEHIEEYFERIEQFFN